MRTALAMAAFLVCGVSAAAETQTGKPAAPMKEVPPDYAEKGKASFYGKQFHGKKTATGERFDKNKKTAAHPTLPLGSKVEVTNLETGKSTEVTINDRGPGKPGRAIDLSERAAKEIGLTKQDGVAPVKIEPAESATASGSSSPPARSAPAAKKDPKRTQAAAKQKTPLPDETSGGSGR